MINKKIASELAVGTVLILALVVGGIFWMQERNSVISNPQSVIENPQMPEVANVQESEVKTDVACTMEAKLCEDGSYVGRTGPNCEFATCPQAGFKFVEVRNPSLRFSFEIPQEWASETRNADIMSDEDFKLFASNERYLDLTPEIIKKSTPEEIKKYREKLTSFPNASVSINLIQYSDWNAAQVDFLVILKKDAENLMVNQKIFKEETLKSLKNDTSIEKDLKSVIPITIEDEFIAGFNAKVLRGGVNSDGYISSGAFYVLDVPNSEYNLAINKQALGNEQFEIDFENIIETLKVSVL